MFLYDLTIHKTIKNCYNVVQTQTRYKSNKKVIDRFKWKVNDNKLQNNLTRAQSNIYNILAYNEFEFFYTQTISSVYARTDLKRLVKKISDITRILRRDNTEDLYYLIVPEYHSDNKCWHIHGFLSKGYSKYMYVNKNGYFSLSCFDKIGFNSISKINNYEACCKYATKYACKYLINDLKKGERVFYCTQKLLRRNVVVHKTISQIAPVHYDYKNCYVFKASNLSEEKVNDLLIKSKTTAGITTWDF